MKVDVVIGPDIHDVKVTDKETGKELAVTRLVLTLEANEMPSMVLDVEADKVTVNGKDINAEIGQLTMLHVESWVKRNGFKLVPDDELDVELGRDGGK